MVRLSRLSVLFLWIPAAVVGAITLCFTFAANSYISLVMFST